MLVVNKLTKAGGIRSIVIRESTVAVRTRDGNEIVYVRRNYNAGLQKVQVRRGALPAKL